MNRRLIGVIAGISVLGLGVPAFAAARGGDGTPEDNDVPGDVRGNCDEAEHAADAECLSANPSTATIVVTLPATLPASTEPETTEPATTEPATTEATVPEDTTPDEGTLEDDDVDETVPGTVPATTPVATVEDVSGPCDEAEHADDPRCTGAPRVDNSGPGNAGVDNSGPGNAEDNDDADVEDNSGRGNNNDDQNDDEEVDDNDDDQAAVTVVTVEEDDDD